MPDFELAYSAVCGGPFSMPSSAEDLSALTALPPGEQGFAFASIAVRNDTVRAALERLAGLELPTWCLTAGSLFQTVWNAAAGRDDLNHGIKDHDLFFYDADDLSYEAEDLVIRKVLRACDDLGIDIEPRNQARVHLWYGPKFGRDIGQYRDLAHAISSFAATSCCVALSLQGDRLSVHTTHGFEDLFNLVLRPNPVTLAPQAVYDDKAARWLSVWPQLTKLPWRDPDAV